MNITNAKETPYFERALPRYMLHALQAAWDQADGRSFGALAIYNGFCRSLKEVGHEAPLKPEFSQWIADVQTGKIPRPGQPVAVEEWTVNPMQKGAAERVKEFLAPNGPFDTGVKAAIAAGQPYVLPTEMAEPAEQAVAEMDEEILAAVDTVLSQPFFTPEFQAETQSEFNSAVVSEVAMLSMRAVRDQMVSDLVEQLQANARAQAEAVVISVLRDVAAEMERASQ